MPPAAVISAVLPVPATGDLRAAPPAVTAGADANAAAPPVEGGFGRALGEAMNERDQTSGPSRKRAAARDQDSAPSVAPVAVAVQDPALAAGTRPALPAVIAPPAQAPTGNSLPLADQALPRAVPAVPAGADMSHGQSRASELLLPVASGAQDRAVARTDATTGAASAAATPDAAAATPTVAMPVAGSVAVVPPESAVAGSTGADDALAASAATPRHQTPAPAPQGGQQGAPEGLQGNAQPSDNAAAPWLRMLAQARELAAEPGPESPDMDGAGPLSVAAGERAVTAGPAMQAPGIAGARSDGGAGPGIFAAPLAVGQAGPEWAGELEARVQWLAGRNLRSAAIQLDPPELGPLQVQVQAHRDGASVHFTTHSAAVRDLVEQSLPRLREMLESSGMNLVDVNVAQQQGGRGEREASPASTVGAAMRGEAQAMDAATVVVMSPRGLVDAYA
jgi:flagellar hook-length control protein FliK